MTILLSYLSYFIKFSLSFQKIKSGNSGESRSYNIYQKEL